MERVGRGYPAAAEFEGSSERARATSFKSKREKEESLGIVISDWDK